MADSPTSSQLATAYQLIKAGQRQQASRILKSYLALNARDPKAWWLMAYAVDKPDSIRRCLENVLKLDPTHAKAREKLARLSAANGDEPDDSFFDLTASRIPSATVPSRTAPPVAPTRPKPPRVKSAMPAQATTPTRSPALKFEEFAASAPAGIDPFTAVPADDPFADVPRSDAAPPYNPFASQNTFNPAAHASMGNGAAIPAQAPGTGGQPVWGPGLAFVQDIAAPVPRGNGGSELPCPVDADIQRERHAVERMIGFAVVAMAIVVLVGLVLYTADRQGWIQLAGGEKVPAMVALDGGSFSIDYPEGWDVRCLREASGYPVCGIANHAFYNEVDWFAGQNVDIGTMVSQSLNMALSGEDLPETQVSIIVMDVPMTSPAYDNGSWAKTKYEMAQQGWVFDSKAKITYDRKEIMAGGYTAQYYSYTSQGNWEDVAWDVYVPHDGIILWLRVVFWGKQNAKIPDATVRAMINSIVFKPVDQWQ
jgi:hypothetical protein